MMSMRKQSNTEAGEKLGQGFVISLDEEAGLIRLKMWGQWTDLDAETARGMADKLEALPFGPAPRAYDVQGRPIGSAIDRLRKFADELEGGDQ